MIETALGTSIAFTAPHRLATKAGYDILEAGGTAIEAMVAAAAQIAVVYPHMNSIGGDGFWLIKKKGQTPVAISACGPYQRVGLPLNKPLLSGMRKKDTNDFCQLEGLLQH